MNKKYHIIILAFVLLLISNRCSKDFLEVRPNDGLNDFTLASEEGIDALLIGAYSMLDGTTYGIGWEAASSNWLYGDIRGMIANIGTDAGDGSYIHSIKRYVETSTNPWLNVKWMSVYEAISRCNRTIAVINQALADGNITDEKAELLLQQARVLRGWYHFEAWRMWQMIPYIDENTDQKKITNKTDIRLKIIEDLNYGVLLPDNMGQIGRFNSTVSKVLLAKAKMQMFHEYDEALIILKDVKDNGTKPNGEPIGLAPTFGEIFDIENRNGIESVYTVQYSVNDGSGGWNGGYGESLNFPYKGGGSPAGCCSFFQPAQEFVNSFSTTEDGLPMLDYSYNLPENSDFRDLGVNAAGIWDSTKIYGINQACTFYDSTHPYIDLNYISLIPNNQGNVPQINSDAWELKWKEDNSRPIDPRLDWTVGRRGIPYWDWGIHTGSDWIRDQSYAGPYSPKKQVYKKSQEGQYTEVGSWTSGYTANGYRFIRFADVLLLLAECQIETGDLAGALENINAVRTRAANPEGFVKEEDGLTPAANYNISVYSSFSDVEYARKALQMERKLELGMEGHRWFDLNRWGNAVEEVNTALFYEKTTPWGQSMYGNAFVGFEDLFYPIPQRQIDLSNGNLVQNR